MKGLVIARTAKRAEVWLPERKQMAVGFLRGKLIKEGKKFFTGDWVGVKQISPQEVIIESVMERKNLIPKPAVANVDKALVIISWRKPEFNNLILDGILAELEFLGVNSVIVINKTDLVRKKELRKLEERIFTYTSIGYHVLCTSVKRGEGLQHLSQEIQGQIVILAGPSGGGKSSILNAIIPGAELHTEEVSEKAQRGRHTTTEVRLLSHSNGGWVADTPGFSRVELPERVEAETIPWLYREFHLYRCGFNNCTHTAEPNCAVKQAVSKNQIHPDRYNTYLYWLNACKG